MKRQKPQTAHAAFVDALRACLGLQPLYRSTVEHSHWERAFAEALERDNNRRVRLPGTK